jgi:GH24 family phage-related lysozyme (muramidase)
MNSNPLPVGAQYTDPNQLPAMLWLVEGNVLKLYADPKGIPTIGIGMNLEVPQNMALVLSQIDVNGVNLLSAAAAKHQTVDQVVAAFEAILSQNPLSQSALTRVGNTAEEVSLQTALDTLAANYFNISVNAFENGTASQPRASVTFNRLPASTATYMLGVLLSNTAQTLGGGEFDYGPYPITTYAQQLTQWLTNNTKSGIGAQYDVPAANVPAPNTGQWEALLSLFFNQDPSKSPLIGKGLMNALKYGDAAQAWFQIRYGHAAGQATQRRYYESQMFGLAQPGDTFAQAMQAFEMLTENRSKIITCEQTGTNNDYFLAAACATARLLRLADGPDEVHCNQIGKWELKRHRATDPARTGANVLSPREVEEIALAEGWRRREPEH